MKTIQLILLIGILFIASCNFTDLPTCDSQEARTLWLQQGGGFIPNADEFCFCPSPLVSDVHAFHGPGCVSQHYIDCVGMVELPDGTCLNECPAGYFELQVFDANVRGFCEPREIPQDECFTHGEQSNCPEGTICCAHPLTPTIAPGDPGYLGYYTTCDPGTTEQDCPID